MQDGHNKVDESQVPNGIVGETLIPSSQRDNTESTGDSMDGFLEQGTIGRTISVPLSTVRDKKYFIGDRVLIAWNKHELLPCIIIQMKLIDDNSVEIYLRYE